MFLPKCKTHVLVIRIKNFNNQTSLLADCFREKYRVIDRMENQIETHTGIHLKTQKETDPKTYK
jgi:hypothetical protein